MLCFLQVHLKILKTCTVLCIICPCSHAVIAPTQHTTSSTTTKPPIPPLALHDPPSQPKEAWRTGETTGKPPLPPLSRLSEVDTHRTALSKKGEKLSEEWYVQCYRWF